MGLSPFILSDCRDCCIDRYSHVHCFVAENLSQGEFIQSYHDQNADIVEWGGYLEGYRK
jgi:hypothetical protein